MKLNQSIKDDLDKIVNEIVALLPEAKVILFGSYATGNPDKNSDLDLCVVTDEFEGRRMDMMHTIRGTISDKTHLPLDILLFRSDEFQENAKLKPTIEYAIAKEGIVLNAPELPV